jgi:cellulose biosynthesis protein BcsQ
MTFHESPLDDAMPQVFISYARQDREFAITKIRRLLEALNLDPWIDQEELHASDLWLARIEAALQKSDWFVLLMSEKAAASRHVRAEVDWILKHRPDRLIPIKIAECRPEDIHDDLPTIQHLIFEGSPERMNLGIIKSLLHRLHGTVSAKEERIVGLNDTIEELAEERDELQTQVHELTAQLHAIADFDGDWLGASPHPTPPFIPLSQRRAPVVSLLNLKGGVGKTTLAVNLAAACFRRTPNPKRVLILDLDFQGSATARCLKVADREEVVATRRTSSRLLSDEESSVDRLFACRRRIGDTSGWIVPADDGLARQENRAQARQLTKTATRDVRYLLRALLHADGVQNEFDLVILDCPPRLHVGAVNALAASDFVLIPTLLDLTSTDAIPRLIHWLSRYREQGLCPDLEILGVVANKKSSHRLELLLREKTVWDNFGPSCRSAWKFGDVPLLKTIIPEASAVAEAASTPAKFAYDDSRIRPVFDQLLKEISPRLFPVKKEVHT